MIYIHFRSLLLAIGAEPSYTRGELNEISQIPSNDYTYLLFALKNLYALHMKQMEYGGNWSSA